MTLQHVEAHVRLLLRAYADETNDAAVRYAMNDGKLPKILVQRGKDALLPMRMGQNLVVARVFRPVSRPDDVMTGSLQFLARLAPHAGIEQKFHAPAFKINGSTRSWATSLWA